MDKHVFENLNQYQDFKFFNVLIEKEEEKNKNPEDKRRQEEEKKDAEAILKKVKDNYGRFKSAAGSKIQAYKSFWEHLNKISNQITQKFPVTKRAYPLYDSDYAVILFKEDEDATSSLGVWKYTLEEDEENPVFTAKHPETASEFVEFLNTLKEDFKEIKEKYVKEVQSKKDEEEREKKRKKFDSFLKESKVAKKKRLNEEYDKFFEDEFTPHGYLTLSNWGGIEIELSRDGDGVRYRYTGDEEFNIAEIEYDDEGRPTFTTDEHRTFYLDEFMRVNESQTKKKKLNEWSSSYDNFIDEYAGEMVDIKRMFREIYDNASDEKIMDAFSKIEDRYDPPVVDFLDDYALTPNVPTIKDIADVGLEINNRYGTEMKMVINAIYDLYDEC